MGSKYQSQFTDFYKGKMPTEVPNHKKCDHTWDGWEDFADGNGGTMICSKCGLTAVQWTIICEEEQDK